MAALASTATVDQILGQPFWRHVHLVHVVTVSTTKPSATIARAAEVIRRHRAYVRDGCIPLDASGVGAFVMRCDDAEAFR